VGKTKKKVAKAQMEKSTNDFSNSDKAIRIQSESTRERVKYTSVGIKVYAL